ncbi:CRISPR-associated protein Cas4 [Chloroflexia bacterium SDU3-3]|nr:CRISPR-associated protein Cas4 [Chloroflexia bacterium SDU3-3]
MGISLGLALLVLAVACAIWASSIRRRTGLPWVPVRSQDVLGRELEKPLFSRRLGLTGKPDYLLEIGGALIPVEVKPSRRSPTPYDSDLMQLASYCLLIEETEGQPPPYGLLRYAQRTFRLNYTEQVREDVLALMDEMRALLDVADCARSHDESQRCRSCGFYTICDDAL